MFDLKKLKKYERITRMSKLARRYFVMNSFDGTLTIFGILLGSFVAGISDASLVISISLSAAIAIMVSGAWGTYLSESAERKKELRSMERRLLKKLKGTDIERANSFAAFFVSVIDGLSPALAIVIIISPFFFGMYNIIDVTTAFYIAFILCLSIFLFLGYFLSKISSENPIHTSIKTLIIGLIAGILVYLVTSFTSSPV